ncbi:LOG family protein [Bartonella sp. DGB2]|uniref:LOG family protein n=1 Tax=Bartonella sp. DGB2 TaxID=3388426 RepID=UPI00398FC324
MTIDKKDDWTPLRRPDALDEPSIEIPNTPQTRSSAYRLAYQDYDFLSQRALRSVRIGLELLKAEMGIEAYGIRSTVVLFGGARIPEPGSPAWAAKTAEQKKNLEALSLYYQEARRFAQLCARYGAKSQYREFVIVTGGGPGVMEAGNRGAQDEGAPTIGLNIVLPHEQAPNLYVTPELCFNFHYFGMRKMHFLMRAKVLAIFPGGYGTLDELFEALTLIHTGRMKRIPILMFGKDFWQSALNLEYLEKMGTISPGDLDLLTYVESADEGFSHICNFYDLANEAE